MHCPTTTERAFFWKVHGTQTKADKKMNHKKSLKTLKICNHNGFVLAEEIQDFASHYLSPWGGRSGIRFQACPYWFHTKNQQKDKRKISKLLAIKQCISKPSSSEKVPKTFHWASEMRHIHVCGGQLRCGGERNAQQQVLRRAPSTHVPLPRFWERREK